MFKMTHNMFKSFFLLFVVWTSYNMCILYVKLFFVLSVQYFEKVFVCGFIVLFLFCCCCIYLFCIFVIYSISYCCHYKLMDPWDVCMFVCVFFPKCERPSFTSIHNGKSHGFSYFNT